MKKLKVLITAAILSACMGITALAGMWQPDNGQWKYLNDDGTYYINCWQWIDGDNDGIAECYYFDASGYLLTNTVTPDNQTVDANGAWTVNGIVQTQPVISQTALPVVTETTAAQTQDTQTSASGTGSTGISNVPYDGYTIIVNTNTRKYHSPACKSAKDIHPQNLGYSSDAAYLESLGYVPCKRCH